MMLQCLLKIVFYDVIPILQHIMDLDIDLIKLEYHLMMDDGNNIVDEMLVL